MLMRYILISIYAFFLEIQANLAPRIDPPRELPMTEEVWNSYKNEDGRIVDVNKVKSAIFRGVCLVNFSFASHLS